MKYKHLVQLDINIINRILNGIEIKESKFSNTFDTTKSVFFYFDTLTNIFNDTAYVILQKEHIMFKNIRQYMIWINKDKFVIKLLAADDFYPWMSVLTMSALVGDSILYTQELTEEVSDAGVRNGNIDIKKTRKFNFKDFSYVLIDSLGTTEYK